MSAADGGKRDKRDMLGRDTPPIPCHSAFRFMDVQNYAAHRRGGDFIGCHLKVEQDLAKPGDGSR